MGKRTMSGMFMTRSEYDRGVNTFSPEGRLIQVEYAIEAVKHGSTVIGIETTEGVVLAVEKRLTSPLLEPKSIEKIMEIDEHVGCAMSGLTADALALSACNIASPTANQWMFIPSHSLSATWRCDLEKRAMTRKTGCLVLSELRF